VAVTYCNLANETKPDRGLVSYQYRDSESSRFLAALEMTATHWLSSRTAWGICPNWTSIESLPSF